jgi:hypothetical protein
MNAGKLNVQKGIHVTLGFNLEMIRVKHVRLREKLPSLREKLPSFFENFLALQSSRF